MFVSAENGSLVGSATESSATESSATESSATESSATESSATEASRARWATRLRRVLFMNAEFSLLTGAVGLIGADPVGHYLGVEQLWIVRLLGAGLLGFAALVFVVARAKTEALLSWSQVISLNDVGWVVGTIVVIGLGWLSTRGAAAMSLIGVAVLGLGMAQMLTRRRLIAAMVSGGETPAEG